uniref:PGG domain-containing protein n=1 Tax=Fagus sylvatica TaxID=28930 RepID=A0A2N9G6S2_FAGSY
MKGARTKDTPPSGFNATNGARHQLFPVNYGTCFEFVKLASKSMLVIFGLGSSGIRKIEEKKQKHTWAVQILNELLQYSSLYEYDYTGANPLPATPQDDVGTIPYDVSDGGDINFAGEANFLGDLRPKTPTADTLETKEEEKNIGTGGNDKTKEAKKKKPEKAKKASPILIAAKNGITEIVEESPIFASKNGITELVEKILYNYPVAMYDRDQDKKNIVLLAVEHKQPRVYELLLSLKKKNIIKDSIFCEVDSEGNNALHLAAKKANFTWPVPGAASQMQWEIKWFEYIKNSMRERLILLNKEGKTPEEVFTESHEDLVKKGGEWLTSTSNACSVVAGLFVTVTFTASTTVPDGVKQNNKQDKASKILARKRDFRCALLGKLLVGLTAFYVSIASTLISFSTGHFFVFGNELKSEASYFVTCVLLIIFFAFAQLPLFFHLLWATFNKVPKRNYRLSFPRWFSMGD